MNLSQTELDRIVREVVRRLRASGSVRPAPASRPAPDRVAADRATAGEELAREELAEDGGGRTLRVAERLVTVERLRDRWADVGRIVVRPDALLTPLVRDELRERGIELIRAADPCPGARGGPPVMVGTCDDADRHDPVGGELSRLLRELGATTELVRGSERRVAARVVEAAGTERRLGILVSRRPAAAVCWANRARGVRAVWGVGPDEVARAVREAAVNLLVLGREGRGLETLLKAFVRPGPWQCPEPW